MTNDDAPDAKGGEPQQSHSTPDRNREVPGELTDAHREAIAAAIRALPPLSDEQIDRLCDTIISFRHNRERQSDDTRR